MEQVVSTAWKIIPQFSSRSIAATVAFYKDELHFKLGGEYSHENNDKITFCSISMGDKSAANIYFHLNEELEFHPSSAMIAMALEPLNTFYQSLEAKGKVEITDPIEDKVWGYRQFTVKDLDGNKLSFFAFLSDDEESEEEKDK
jgi:uncharacterized glyoxalase superfamily protein PhnB